MAVGARLGVLPGADEHLGQVIEYLGAAHGQETGKHGAAFGATQLQKLRGVVALGQIGQLFHFAPADRR